MYNNFTESTIILRPYIYSLSPPNTGLRCPALYQHINDIFIVFIDYKQTFLDLILKTGWLEGDEASSIFLPNVQLYERLYLWWSHLNTFKDSLFKYILLHLAN